mmetsp:Transcript_15290/g.27833  ORF Transcript_15290/g.27833 Transcript_15290/m.27833 type:complete len:247 (+) Transcript_15290:119-859(+)
MLRELGKGTFSTVMLAEDKTGRKVALKCISLPQMRSELHLLNREVSILRELDHPNIVKLYCVYSEDEMVYLSMELCEGGSLKERIDRNGALPVATIKAVAKQLLSALHYLHRHNIGHRDLKAENVLFSRDNQVKVADFGLARIMDNMRPYSRVGTPYYIAPEVIHGDFNWQCDVWSAGVVLYFAMAGVMPFEGETMTSLLCKIEGPEVDMSMIPVDAHNFLQNLLKQDCKARYTAEQALRDPWLIS